MRVEQGSFAPSNGGWLHRLRDSTTTWPSTTPRPSASTRVLKFRERACATPDTRHAAYDYLLGQWHLSPAHADNLRARGLTEEAVARNLYSTVPNESRKHEICTEVGKRVTLSGVPGFVQLAEGAWSIAADPGDMVIPCRDHQGRIIALCRRTNDPAAKYKWTSCKQSPSGAPVHHAERWHVTLRPCLYLIEGTLKADVVASMLNFTCIGLPGAAAVPAGLGTDLRDQYPTALSAFIAYDADVTRNAHVAAGRERLTENLRAAGFRVRYIEWSEADAKGLDDLLLRARA
jgi:hypothetical protein